MKSPILRLLFIKNEHMNIIIKIPYAGGFIKVFVYHIPGWLPGAIIVIILLIQALRTHFIHL